MSTGLKIPLFLKVDRANTTLNFQLAYIVFTYGDISSKSKSHQIHDILFATKKIIIFFTIKIAICELFFYAITLKFKSSTLKLTP